MSERVHYNIWQRYILALTLTELSGHVTDKCEYTLFLTDAEGHNKYGSIQLFYFLKPT
jgi:hypothetical protein